MVLQKKPEFILSKKIDYYDIKKHDSSSSFYLYNFSISIERLSGTDSEADCGANQFLGLSVVTVETQDS